MSKRHQLQYLQAMGIQVWVPRSTADIPPPAPADLVEISTETIAPVANPVSPTSQPATSQPSPSPAQPPEFLDWEALKARVAVCTACKLHSTRTQTVFGSGNHEAHWLFVGEAPGTEEDAQGEPFIGQAGQLLNLILQAMGLSRHQVYITNLIKCRPPENRNPHVQEARQCLPFLARQVALLNPRLIVTLGNLAAHHLLDTREGVSKLRGRVYFYRDIPLVATYHPAYLLCYPQHKRAVWADLQMAMQFYREHYQ